MNWLGDVGVNAEFYPGDYNAGELIGSKVRLEAYLVGSAQESLICKEDTEGPVELDSDFKGNPECFFMKNSTRYDLLISKDALNVIDIFSSKVDKIQLTTFVQRDYKTDVTFGKAMHNDPFGSATCVFESDGVKPVRLHFRDPNAEKGIWLNAFELGQWFE